MQVCRTLPGRYRWRLFAASSALNCGIVSAAVFSDRHVGFQPMPARYCGNETRVHGDDALDGDHRWQRWPVPARAIAAKLRAQRLYGSVTHAQIA
jgi:hypothetical protein